MARVAITGIGIVAPGVRTLRDFSHTIKQGRCPVTSLPDAKVPSGQTAVGGRIEDVRSGPGRARELLIMAVQRAIESTDETMYEETGLIVGTSLGDIETLLSEHAHHLTSQPVDGKKFTNSLPEGLTDSVAQATGLHGPQFTLSSACTSGASALGWALDLLRAGKGERYVVAAVDTLNDFVLCGFASLWALTSDTPRPFDMSRTGMALGESAVALQVERLDERTPLASTSLPRAIVSGYGASADAVHITAPDKAGKGAARAMTRALADAEWTPAEVDYLNVHATGSLYNDAMIIKAIEAVFGERGREIPISSVNPATGHTLASAGLVEAVATIVALEEGFIPPTANLSSPEETNLDLVKDTFRPAQLTKALSLTTGFGGANTALALSSV